MDLTIVYQCNADTNLFDSFGDIYEKSFPDEDEREPYGNIRFRTFSDYSAYGNYPATICCFLTEEQKPVGGLICDYYLSETEDDTIDIEIIYLMVDEQYRNQDAGTYLMTTGLQEVIKELTSTGLSVRNIYLETENPDKVETSVIDPEIRIRFFKKLVFKEIKMNYMQPPLSETCEWTDKLILMVLDNDQSGYVKRTDLEEFLKLFYEGLCVEESRFYKSLEEELDKSQIKKHNSLDFVLELK